MPDVLPWCFTNRAECVWDLPGAFTSGGVSTFGGAPIQRRMDGGGSWRMSMKSVLLLDRNDQRLWAALMANWNLGDLQIEVPVQWSRRNASFSPFEAVPFSDGVPFDDVTLFAGGTANGTLAADVALRATTAQIKLPVGAALMGGEPFTLVGSTGARLYDVARVTSVVADPTGDTATIRFGPPAREDYASGATVDFGNPRCLMLAQPQTDGAAPAYGRSRATSASMVFWESPP
jgi:hypothetical protein